MGLLKKILEFVSEFFDDSSNNEKNASDRHRSEEQSSYPMIASDGNMYTKLRGVTEKCIFDGTVNRQAAIASVSERTLVHFELVTLRNKPVLLVVDDRTGFDLGEISHVRTEYLMSKYDNILSIKPKIKNITGGNNYYYGCNIVIDSLPDKEKLIIDNIIDKTDKQYLGEVNYENADKKLIRLIPYNLEYISLSGGYTNYTLFKAEAVINNSACSYELTAKDEKSAARQLKKMDSQIEIKKIEPIQLPSATEEQIKAATEYGYALPDDASAEDADCILDRVTRKDYCDNIFLAKGLNKLGCTFSRFATESQLIKAISEFEQDRDVAAFYYYVFFKHKVRRPLGNFWTFNEKKTCYFFADSVCDDKKMMTSIRKALLSAPDISSGTVAYKKAYAFFKAAE